MFMEAVPLVVLLTRVGLFCERSVGQPCAGAGVGGEGGGGEKREETTISNCFACVKCFFHSSSVQAQVLFAPVPA